MSVLGVVLLRPGPAQQFVFCSRTDFTRIHHDLVLNRRLTEQLVVSFVFVDFLSLISVTFGPDFPLFLLFSLYSTLVHLLGFFQFNPF